MYDSMYIEHVTPWQSSLCMFVFEVYLPMRLLELNIPAGCTFFLGYINCVSASVACAWLQSSVCCRPSDNREDTIVMLLSELFLLLSLCLCII